MSRPNERSSQWQWAVQTLLAMTGAQLETNVTWLNCLNEFLKDMGQDRSMQDLKQKKNSRNNSKKKKNNSTNNSKNNNSNSNNNNNNNNGNNSNTNTNTNMLVCTRPVTSEMLVRRSLVSVVLALPRRTQQPCHSWTSMTQNGGPGNHFWKWQMFVQTRLVFQGSENFEIMCISFAEFCFPFTRLAFLLRVQAAKLSTTKYFGSRKWRQQILIPVPYEASFQTMSGYFAGSKTWKGSCPLWIQAISRSSTISACGQDAWQGRVLRFLDTQVPNQVETPLHSGLWRGFATG